MAGDITVNKATEYYLRQNRRVYSFLQTVVDDKSKYDLNSSHKDGGDNFLSPQAMVTATPNIFDLLSQFLPEPKEWSDKDFVNTNEDEDLSSRFQLDYKFDTRSTLKVKPREVEKANKKAPELRTQKDKETIFIPEAFTAEITDRMKANAITSYFDMVRKAESIYISQEFNDVCSVIAKKEYPGLISNKLYFNLIDYLFFVIQVIEATNDSIKSGIDWNSEEFVLDQFCIHEIKMALNFIGAEAIGVVDINMDFDKKTKVCDNQVWLIILINFIGTVAYQLPLTIIPMYIQALYNETSTFSGAFQYAFSAVQAFGVVLFHRVSEHIGRKPVLVMVFLVYAITNIVSTQINIENTSKISGIPKTDTVELSKAVCTGQVVIRAVQGLFGLCTPMTISMISDVAAPSVRAAALSLSGGIEIGACTLGFLLVSFGVSNIPYAKITADTKENSVFICGIMAASLYVISAAITLFGLKETSAAINAKNAGKKLGITVSKDQSGVKPDSFKTVFKYFWTNKTLVLIFFDYLLILGNTQITSATTGSIMQQYLDKHLVELGTEATLNSGIGCGLATIFLLTCLSPIVKKIGELKTTAIFISITAIYLIYLASGPPLVNVAWSIIGMFIIISIIVAEACLMTLVADQTTPHNRASVSGIMQIANSLGRVITPLIWPYWMDHNMRDALYGNIMCAAGVLFITAFITGVVQTPDVMKRKDKVTSDKLAYNKV